MVSDSDDENWGGWTSKGRGAAPKDDAPAANAHGHKSGWDDNSEHWGAAVWRGNSWDYSSSDHASATWADSCGTQWQHAAEHVAASWSGNSWGSRPQGEASDAATGQEVADAALTELPVAESHMSGESAAAWHAGDSATANPWQKAPIVSIRGSAARRSSAAKLVPASMVAKAAAAGSEKVAPKASKSGTASARSAAVHGRAAPGRAAPALHKAAPRRAPKASEPSGALAPGADPRGQAVSDRVAPVLAKATVSRAVSCSAAPVLVKAAPCRAVPSKSAAVLPKAAPGNRSFQATAIEATMPPPPASHCRPTEHFLCPWKESRYSGHCDGCKQLLPEQGLRCTKCCATFCMACLPHGPSLVATKRRRILLDAPPLKQDQGMPPTLPQPCHPRICLQGSPAINVQQRGGGNLHNAMTNTPALNHDPGMPALSPQTVPQSGRPPIGLQAPPGWPVVYFRERGEGYQQDTITQALSEAGISEGAIQLFHALAQRSEQGRKATNEIAQPLALL